RAIQDSMAGRELPEAISHFIAEQWQDVLFSTIVKHGDESELWQDHLQTMQDLIWSSQKHSDEKSISRFEALKHGLYQKLQGGLASTNASSEQSEAAIKAIIQVHHDLNDSDASDVVMETFKSEESESMEALKQQKTWKEMTALERQKVKYQALEYEFIKKAEALNVGDWLEFKQMSSGTVTRCKLAAKLDASDSYIFVNRLGFKVLEKARKEVAYDMQRDRARVLETGPAFERSLHRMVTNLKNITSQVRR
ncbi:DUF1631 domain-containing protein, partial [bacterium]|nr:DUF1631 domain-containing protein [bacterium]